jgi:hypothetical protein
VIEHSSIEIFESLLPDGAIEITLNTHVDGAMAEMKSWVILDLWNKQNMRK